MQTSVRTLIYLFSHLIFFCDSAADGEDRNGQMWTSRQNFK